MNAENSGRENGALKSDVTGEDIGVVEVDGMRKAASKQDESIGFEQIRKSMPKVASRNLAGIQEIL